MSIALRNVFITKNPTSHLPFSHSKSPQFQFLPLNSRIRFQNLRFVTSQPHPIPITKIKASFDEASQNQVSENRTFNFDDLLSVLEFLSLASSAGVAVYIVVVYWLQKAGIWGWMGSKVLEWSGSKILGWSGSKILVWQCVLMVSCMVIGAVIRRRQWRRICGVELSRRGDSYGGANWLERVEKLEDDLRSSATIVRVLSRQLEKLGIRFRVTRKALKEPIAESAELVQKNSEATRALAAQEDILEKELAEIQKVLLAMQEQQQKQLELILAIAKAGKSWETKPAKTRDQKASKSSVPVSNLKTNEIETAINDRP